MKILITCHYHDEKTKLFYKNLINSWNRFSENNVEFCFLFVSVIGGVFPTCNYEYYTLSLKDINHHSYLRRVEKTYIKTAEYIRDNIDCDMWFWYETDIEIVDNKIWDKLANLWNKKRQIMGFWVTKEYRAGKRAINTFNGASFYAKNYIDFVKPHIEEGRDFDRWIKYNEASKDENSIAVPINDIYACMHHIYDRDAETAKNKASIIHYFVSKSKKKEKVFEKTHSFEKL